MDESITGNDGSHETANGAYFPTTDWGMITRFHATDPVQAMASLDRLCEKYWYPVYAYIRRSGNNPHDSEDLTQGFFAHILSGDALRQVDSDRGRFRSFLLTSARNFLINEWSRRNAVKRGVGLRFVSRDSADPEKKYLLEPASNLTPDLLFERRWALATIEAALEKLHRDCEKSGKAAVFGILKPMLIHTENGSIAKAARDLAMSEPAMRVALHRLRRRLGSLLRGQIALTVGNEDEVEDELRHLLSLLD